MKLLPANVSRTRVSLNDLRNWTSGETSLPYAAVAIMQRRGPVVVVVVVVVVGVVVVVVGVVVVVVGVVVAAVDIDTGTSTVCVCDPVPVTWRVKLPVSAVALA